MVLDPVGGKQPSQGLRFIENLSTVKLVSCEPCRRHSPISSNLHSADNGVHALREVWPSCFIVGACVVALCPLVGQSPNFGTSSLMSPSHAEQALFSVQCRTVQRGYDAGLSG